MFRMSNQFTQLASQIREKGLNSKIFQQQSAKYDLATYKINSISTQSMTKLYENIWKKYKITKELSENENSWHQNERRVFVWFILCYTYLIKTQVDFTENKLIHDEAFWNELSPVFFNKNPQLLQFQYLNMIKTKKRQIWTAEEDSYLLEALRGQEEGRWNEVSKKMFYNSNKACFRTPKQCRERWLNHLDKSKKHGSWTTTEDYVIFKYILEHGKHWSKIVPLLDHSRTEHMIKNRYNSLISKFININNNTQLQATEIIFNALEKQVLKQTESSSSEEKSQQKKTESSMTIEDDYLHKNEEILGEKSNAQILTPEASLESVKVYQHHPSVIYAYYMDINSNIFIHPFIVFPQPSIYSAEMNDMSFKVSANSCFRTYSSQVQV